ncbi:hypothetical protein CAPN008_05780 [Capnocytophaga canis]|uniref:hypothetical protein n=1 Tax=Capnocytophaga canis TaxID=1848903 RepID=UPI001AC5F21F
MEKQIFKVGDRVFHYNFKWGEVIKTYEKEPAYGGIGVLVDFDDVTQIAFEGKGLSSLSFTEYTLKGFSQERPINYEDYIGKWGKFWDDDIKEEIVLSKFERYEHDKDYPFITENQMNFKNFQPLTEEQIKILELE